MGFSDLPPVETADKYLDAAFRKARTDARTYQLGDHEKSALQREKTLGIIKIASVRDYIVSHFEKIIALYPNFDNLSEFYTQLMKLSINFKMLKKSMGSLQWLVQKTQEFSRTFTWKLKKAADQKQAAETQSQYYGRIASLFKQVKKELHFLHDARQILRTFPSIKEGLFTICIAGFPNVGKSTLLSKLTPAKPEIGNYAFTTTSLNMGYALKNGVKFQFMDTPGTLARPEKMNSVEKQASLAMKYAAQAIIYVFDITETSYSLHEQQKLLRRIKELDKPILCYLSKTDILSDEQIEGFKVLFGKKKIPLFTEFEEIFTYLYDLYRKEYS